MPDTIKQEQWPAQSQQSNETTPMVYADDTGQIIM